MDQRPKNYPKASDLVNQLIEDVRSFLFYREDALSDDDTKWLKDKFHVSVRLHRHEQERFGKKWKRSRERLKAGPAVHL